MSVYHPNRSTSVDDVLGAVLASGLAFWGVTQTSIVGKPWYEAFAQSLMLGSLICVALSLFASAVRARRISWILYAIALAQVIAALVICLPYADHAYWQ